MSILEETYPVAQQMPPALRLRLEELSLSETEIARRDFLQRAQAIPHVSIQRHDGGTVSESSIRVIVPDILGLTADQIYALEVLIRRQYRHAHLQLEVVDTQHRNEKIFSVLAL